MPLFRASFLLNSLDFSEDKYCDGSDLCLRISLPDTFEIDYLVNCKVSFCREGKRILFFLKDSDSPDTYLDFTYLKLTNWQEGPLASYRLNISDIISGLTEKSLDKKKTKRSVSADLSYSSIGTCSLERENHPVLPAPIVVKKIIPLLNKAEKTVGCFVMTMSFTYLGETEVKRFRVYSARDSLMNLRNAVPRSKEGSSYEPSSTSTDSSDDSISHVRKKLKPLRNSLYSSTSYANTTSNNNSFFRTPGNNHNSHSSVRINNAAQTGEKERKRFYHNDKIRVKIHREALCPLTACQSVELCWKIPDLGPRGPRKIRTTDTQIDPELLIVPPALPETTKPPEPLEPEEKIPKKKLKKGKGKKKPKKLKKKTSKEANPENF
ncbi:hypothetical protein DMENIID0001_170800 [Sergentomyia squamirostris]